MCNTFIHAYIYIYIYINNHFLPLGHGCSVAAVGQVTYVGLQKKEHSVYYYVEIMCYIHCVYTGREPYYSFC